MSRSTPDWVTAGIAEVLDPEPQQQVIPGRYPFTYAYDLIRTHQTQFGIAPGTAMMSRSQTAQWLRLHLDVIDSLDIRYITVCETLADAYIKLHNLTWRGVEQ